MSKPRIAIIGGGPAGLSTAFHLTNEENWDERIESITVYQMGWRLGGKGATGRDASKNHRLEEHGIHGFCRFYFNTFRMMEHVYGELSEENRALLPVHTMDDAFIGSSYSLGAEFVDGKWSVNPSHLPRWPGKPWGASTMHTDEAFDTRDIVVRILEVMLRRGRADPLEELSSIDLVPPGHPQDLELSREIDVEIRRARKRALGVARTGGAEMAAQLAECVEALAAIRPNLARLFGLAIDEARPAGSGNVAAYGALTTLDLYSTLLRGLVADWILWPGRDLDEFDREDYRAWLKRHGASPATLDSSSVYSIANMLFAYPEGDTRAEPALSAAAWLGWILRTFRGRGEYFYLMAAGTGETVILPLYLVLKQRGVKFEFFHRLTAVESERGAEGELSVRRLVFDRQARSKGEAGYDPVDKTGMAFGVWPNGPIVDRLEPGKHDQDYEAWDDRRVTEQVELLRGEGFAYVVWAIPPSMIPIVGDEALRLCWKPVSEHLTTTATQAAQIWLTRPTLELGPPCQYPERYATASFPNPLNGMVSFDDVLCFEGWQASQPAGLFYLCGPLCPAEPPTEKTRPNELRRATAATLETLLELGHFFPKARPDQPDPSEPNRIDFDLLYVPAGDSSEGADRIGAQYFRVNTRPTEAYVQAPKGSARGRLDPWDCGYSNLVPAGDWIYTGINVGAFESAVTGGKLAAFALTGEPAIDEIEAYDYFHPRAARRANRATKTGRVPRIR